MPALFHTRAAGEPFRAARGDEDESVFKRNGWQQIALPPMLQLRTPRFRHTFGLPLMLIALGSTVGAVPPPPTRIDSYFDNNDRFTLRGNTRPVVAKGIAHAEGRLSSSFLLPHIVLHFTLTPAQQADLAQLLKEQQDRRSPEYHRFLTPEQYAARFGLAEADIARITGWLDENGFSNAQVAHGKTWVSFSGTAAQVESAFHITLRRYQLNGETHYANASDPELPTALEGIVEGVRGLHNFAMKRFSRRPSPKFTLWGGNTHFLTPDDWSTIYNVKPLYGAGTDGTGVTIAVVGQSEIQLNDIRAFRAASGLPAKDPTVIVPPSLQAPGIEKTSGDEIESDLDLEWAGAIARNANIVFVTASATAGQGVEDALTYAIDHNVAPIISISYGGCEADASTTEFQTANSLLQQANAQGITVVAASGDSGPAACDTGPNTHVASHGYAVSFPASSAYVTGVGGTIFNDTGLGSWTSSNNGAGGSALGYMPENVWDDGYGDISWGASGGGASVLVKKPAWQGGTGVPADNARDVPDVAFTASPNLDGYLICSDGSCRNGFFDLNNNLFVIGGTSASAPVFAGVLALVIQEHGAGTRLGNINPNLYSLAQFSTNIFHDVTVGGNYVPCTPSAACQSSIGFPATPGYDQATGWGSIDATQFAEQWYGDFQISANPAALTLQPGSSGTAEITLTPQNNFNGPVTFSCTVPASLADVSCSVLRGPLNGSGTTTITINAASTARSPWWKNIRRGPWAGNGPLLAAAFIILLFAIATPLAARGRLRPYAGLYAAGLIGACLFAVVTIGCGGSSSGSSSSSNPAPAPTPPPVPKLTVSCTLNSPLTVNQYYSLGCAANGGTGAYTFNVISGTLPMGLALDPYTGIISGAPITPGNYSFSVQVTDSGSPQQSANYAETNLVIVPYASSLNPVRLACSLPAGAVTGANYTGSCTASGGAGGFEYAIASGSLPPGLGLDELGGNIQGVPTIAGTFSFTVQATDISVTSLTATQAVSFAVGIGPLESLSCTNAFASTFAGEQYSSQCSPLGGQSPFTYAVTSGAMPQGLTLNASTGVVSGFPTIPKQTSDFTITVTDSSVPAHTASQNLSIWVSPLVPITLDCPVGLEASFGNNYNAACNIGYAEVPYTVSVLSGQLPPGLHLDSATGVISGIATATGTYPFTLQVIDSSIPARSAQTTTSITVGPRLPETGLITITATSGSIVSTTTLQVTVP